MYFLSQYIILVLANIGISYHIGFHHTIITIKLGDRFVLGIYFY